MQHSMHSLYQTFSAKNTLSPQICVVINGPTIPSLQTTTQSKSTQHTSCFPNRRQAVCFWFQQAYHSSSSTSHSSRPAACLGRIKSFRRKNLSPKIWVFTNGTPQTQPFVDRFTSGFHRFVREWSQFDRCLSVCRNSFWLLSYDAKCCDCALKNGQKALLFHKNFPQGSKFFLNSSGVINRRSVGTIWLRLNASMMLRLRDQLPKIKNKK